MHYILFTGNGKGGLEDINIVPSGELFGHSVSAERFVLDSHHGTKIQVAIHSSGVDYQSRIEELNKEFEAIGFMLCVT